MNRQFVRTLVERVARNRTFRRRLPPDFGRRVIWVSPDARLRFLNLGANGFDQELLNFAKNFVKAGDIVIDVGANVGEFSLAAAHRAGTSGAVLSIEADPFLSALFLRTTAEQSNRDIHLDVLCSAVADSISLAEFTVAARGRAANALKRLGSSQMGGLRQEFLVQTTTIDELVAQWRSPTIIKIDVEGAEHLVLRGAVNTLERHRPIVLFEASKDLSEIEALLARQRYRLFDPTNKALDVELAHCRFNTLAVPEEAIAGRAANRAK